MKVNFRTVALFLVLGTTMAGCQKEDLSNNMTGTEQAQVTIKVVYSVDGEMFNTELSGEDAWNDFIYQMLALAREGHEVAFSRNGSLETSATKEKVVFVTDSDEEAHQWANKMTAQGYIVSIEFDESTGKYTCTAIK